MFKQFETNVTKNFVQVSDVAHGLLFSNPVKSKIKIHVMIVPASYALVWNEAVWINVLPSEVPERVGTFSSDTYNNAEDLFLPVWERLGWGNSYCTISCTGGCPGVSWVQSFWTGVGHTVKVLWS